MSARTVNRIIVILSLIGLGISLYLTYTHYFGLAPLCLASGGCETVQSSKYAVMFGIPVPLIGVAGYAAMLVSLRIRSEFGRLLGVLLTVGGFAFSAYLTYLELFVIHAICQWCATSALVVTVLACLMTYRYLSTAETSSAADEATE